MIEKCGNTNNIKIKNENGITILALVVTIIIILIIAGISIWTLTGDKNVINQSMEARNQTVSKDIEEEVIQQWLLVQNDIKFEYPTNEELAQKLQDRLNKTDNSVQVVSTSNNKFKVKYKSQSFLINYDGIVESILPIEFQQVEYIESTGTQYIDTGIYGDETLSIKFGYKMMSSEISYLFGACKDYKTNVYSFSFNKANNNNYRVFIGSSTPIVGNFQNTFSKLTEIKNATITNNCAKLNDEEYSFSSIAPFMTPYTIAVFARNNNGKIDYFSRIRLSYFQMLKNNIITRNFIPCKTTTTVIDVKGKECPKDTIGLYDKVEGEFYTNQGTGEFLKGEDV